MSELSLDDKIRRLLVGGYTIEIGENAQFFYFATLKAGGREVELEYGKQPIQALEKLIAKATC